MDPLTNTQIATHILVGPYYNPVMPIPLLPLLFIPIGLSIRKKHKIKKCSNCIHDGLKCSECKHCGKKCKYCRKDDCRPNVPRAGSEIVSTDFASGFGDDPKLSDEEQHFLDDFVDMLQAAGTAHGYPDVRVGIALSDVHVEYFNGFNETDESTTPTIDALTGIVDIPDGTGHIRMTGMWGAEKGEIWMPALDVMPCWRPNGTVLSVAADGTEAKLGDWMVEYGGGCAHDAWDPCANAVAVGGYVPHCNVAPVDPATGAAFGAMSFYT